MSAAAEPTSATTGPVRPQALSWVTRGVWAQVVVGVTTAVLVVVQGEALMDAWTAGQPPDSTIAPLSFVPVALVCCGTFVGSALLMLAFLRAGHGWARWCLAAIVAFVVLATVAALRTSPPVTFVVVSVVGLVVEVATLVALWRPSVSRFLREVAASERPAADLS